MGRLKGEAIEFAATTGWKVIDCGFVAFSWSFENMGTTACEISFDADQAEFFTLRPGKIYSQALNSEKCWVRAAGDVIVADQFIDWVGARG